MKMNLNNYLTITLACAGTLFFAACEKKSEPPAGETTTAPAAKKQEAPDPNLPEKKVEIVGNDQMKFDVTTIDAKPGQKVTVTLKNVGTMPKVSMGHNFVLLTADTDINKFVEAGTPHMGKDYIAPEMAGSVIANTKLLGPGESDTISFAAPRKPGTYPYICSFPGHAAIGMKGVLTVQ